MAKPKKHRYEKIRSRYPRAYEPWLAEEDDLLLRYANMSVSDLANRLKRQPSAIESRRRKLAEERTTTPSTATGGMVADVRAPSLPKKSDLVVASQAPPPEKRRWTPEEDEKVRRFANSSVPALAEILNRAEDDVETRLYALGLYARGEAPHGKARPEHFAARKRRWRVSVACFFTAGAILGVIAGLLLPRGNLPPPETVDLAPPSRSLVSTATTVTPDACIRVATWNIRGYPERRRDDTEWFHRQLRRLRADVLCIQEIANGQRIAELRARQTGYQNVVFTDSGSGHDNAILVLADFALDSLEVPSGFQHPPQVAFVAHEGFDAVVITIHLTWEPETKRLGEMRLLEPLVRSLLMVDPDVMIVGDFNLRPDQANSLATQLGMSVQLGRNQVSVGTLHSGNSYDYFFLSPDLATEEAQGADVVVFDGPDLEIARRVSDHIPVIAYFGCDDRFRDRPARQDESQ